MFNSLDFPMVANTDLAVFVKVVRRRNKSLVNLTGFTILWGLFLNGIQQFSKSTADPTQILISDQSQPQNFGWFTLFLNAADTVSVETEIEYTHEFSITDPFSKSGNLTNDDFELSPGKVWIRRQLKAQGSP